MSFVKWVIQHLAPIFIVTSPVTSYADQIWSVSKSHSSAGFSLDIPLIMLVSSILKLFYWLGARYDVSLLVQATVMIGVQLLLLHVTLLYRPAVGAQYSLGHPFAESKEQGNLLTARRPGDFWQWRNRKPYFHFLAYYAITLGALQFLLGSSSLYVLVQGYVALGVEALLPIPQILENQRNQSCKGFRFTVLVNWLIGDAFKLTYFFLSDGGRVPWAFKLCGLFQAACDCYLGVQYWMFGEGEAAAKDDGKETRLA